MSVPERFLRQTLERLNELYRARRESGDSQIFSNSDVSQSALKFGEIDILEKLSSYHGISKNNIYQAIINAVSAIFYVIDDRLRMVGWNHRLEEVAKRTTEEMRDTICLELVSPSVWPETLEAIEKIVSGHPFASVEVPLTVSDGTFIPYLMSGNVLPLGERWYLFGYGLDISDLKKAEHTAERLTALEHLLARMAGDLLAMVAGSEEEGLSRAVEPVARFMRMDYFSICTLEAPYDTVRVRASWHREALDANIDSSSLFSFPLVRETLESLEPFLLNDMNALQGEAEAIGDLMKPFGVQSLVIVPMAVAGELIGFIRLESFRKNAINPEQLASLEMTGQFIANVLIRLDKDQRLAERDAELKATLAATGDGILVLNIYGEVILTNQRFADLFKLDEKPRRGTRLEKIGELLTELLPKGSLERIFPNSIAVMVPEQTLTLTDGRQIEVRCHPFRRKGSIEGLVCTFRDVTAERNLELQLQQAQKLDSIGRLASGVAHDFNNVLFGITSICDVRLYKKDISPQDERDFQKIKEATERAASLTRQLLAFSREQVMSMKPVSLNSVVENMSEIITRLIGDRIAVKLALNARRDTIRADFHQLEQVLLNLAVNARDAMPDGGSLLIETSDLSIDKPLTDKQPALQQGAYSLLRVMDTGCGMDDETIAKVFDPFFTTKEVGQGTGLGLSIIYGIIRQHGGHIEVQSRVGEGTNLEIFLPCESIESLKKEETDRVSIPGSLGETVLLVEDDAVVRDGMRLMLETGGYNVVSAANGEEALLFAEDVRPDLLLTDVAMPMMGGPKLYRKLLEKYPRLPVVFVSGYTEDPYLKTKQANVLMRFLKKPVSMITLLGLVRSLLDLRAVPRLEE